MHPIDWLNDEALELPRPWPGGDFPGFLKELFANFINLAGQLVESDYVSGALCASRGTLSQVCHLVEESIGAYFRGFPHKAFSALDAGINALGQHYFVNLASAPDFARSLQYLYRVRVGNPVTMSRAALFHIPFELREKVGPQRYSIPGLPCLYLGGSVYVCWEEMQRPDVNSLHVSRFQAVEGAKLRVLDFGYRPALVAAMYDHYGKKGELDDKNRLTDFIVAYCLSWPLIAACSIRVRDRSAPFKPEYVFPHLLLQWITHTHEWHGVRYFSANVDKYYTDPMACANFVFPAKQPGPRGHCPFLLSQFHLSQPAHWQLATALPTGAEYAHGNWDIELIKDKQVHYAETDFGMMQSRIAALPTGPV